MTGGGTGCSGRSDRFSAFNKKTLQVVVLVWSKAQYVVYTGFRVAEAYTIYTGLKDKQERWETRRIKPD